LLRAVGRLSEALGPLGAGLAIRLKQGAWRNAARFASNLSELHLTLGEVIQALRAAKESLTYADRSEIDVFERVSGQIRLADSYLAAGQLTEANKVFSTMETDLLSSNPAYRWLPGNWGFRHDGARLSGIESSVWRRIMGTDNGPASGSQVSAAESVRDRAIQRMEEDIQEDQPPLDIALDYLAAGRAALYASILKSQNLAQQGINEKTFAAITDHAVNGLRRAGYMDDLPRGLLTRAWLRVLENDAHGAQLDLYEAWEIAERGPMRLHMTDIHLHRARLFHTVKPYPWNKFPDGTEGRGPKDDLAAARKLIKDCGYHRRDEELADAEEAAKNWK
jgi:hypothetical protein